MSALATALLAELSESDLDVLAERLRSRLQPESADQGYLDVTGAASFLACPPSRIYALVSARRIPFYKDGSRTLFLRDELREYVQNGGARRP